MVELSQIKKLVKSDVFGHVLTMLPQKSKIEVRHLDQKVQTLGAGNLFENGGALELDMD